MTIAVGTTNKAKVDAVTEVLQEYTHLTGAIIKPTATSSGVSDQPLSLQETVEGALHRAHSAYKDCDYSIGIESGLFEVPKSKSGYMDVCVCAIYDGKEFHMGLSSAWEFPDSSVIKDLMLQKGMTMSEAINKAGYTKNESIGSAEGAVGILTKGRVDRKEQAKQAIRMALIHIDTH